MGWFDDLKKAITRRAAEEGAKAAAKDATRRVEEMAEGLLGDAEKELDEARSRHDARYGDSTLPSTSASDPDWARKLKETEASARRTRREVAGLGAKPAPQSAAAEEEAAQAEPAEDPEAKARRELAELKKKLLGDLE